jgi:hypothetical protein
MPLPNEKAPSGKGALSKPAFPGGNRSLEIPQNAAVPQASFYVRVLVVLA